MVKSVILKILFFIYLITNNKCVSAQNSKLEGLGIGLDILTNEVKLPLIQYTYSNTQTTSDRLYYVPDCMIALPNINYDFTTSTTIIESLKKFTSLKSSSVNFGGIIPLEEVFITGSLSNEWQTMLSIMTQQKSVVTRAKYIINQYILEFATTSGCSISVSFKNDLSTIISYIQSNKVNETQKAVQDLINHYGTHYVTQANIGGFIYAENYLKESYWIQEKNNFDEFKSLIDISLFKIINIAELSTNINISDSSMSSFTSSIISTKINVYGGYYTPGMSAVDWSKTLPNNLAITDRKVSLLSDFITIGNFPNFDKTSLAQLTNYVNDGIKAYIKANSKRGCMDRLNSKYDPTANVEDKTFCAITPQFGGFYGTLDMGTLHCYIKNFDTSSFSCGDSYVPYELNLDVSGYKLELSQCYSTTISRKRIVFGGMYSQYSLQGLLSSPINNPLTMTTSCPPYFKSYSLFEYVNTNDPLGTMKYTCDIAAVCLAPYRDDVIFTEAEFGGFIKEDGNFNPWTNSSQCPDGYTKELGMQLGYSGAKIYYCMKTPNGPINNQNQISISNILTLLLYLFIYLFRNYF